MSQTPPLGTMTPDDFRRIRQIFEAALDRPLADRRAFLDGACADDEWLRAEVEQMMAADAQTHAFIDADRPGAAPKVMVPDTVCPSCGAALAASPKFCPECGSPLAADGVEGRFRAGALFASRFRIVAALGRGGMGEVYRAHDLELGQPVALKFLSALRSDERARQRLRNEVRLARQLAHPNVCRVYDIGEAHGELYLSMEYVDGEDLAALLKRIGRLPVDKGIEIARKLCAGLAAAHAKGVLHRDFKPANIMIDAGGEVRIMDFGLAAVSSELDAKDIRSGTPAYMAPEQLAGREATVRSDLYGLGLVLYELFTGKAPFDARDANELQRQRKSRPSTAPATLIPDLGSRVERAILRCLEPDPQLRPASALEVSVSLPGGDPLAEALAAGETPSPEMVAAAGSNEIMAPRIALALLATGLISLAGILWLTPKLHVLSEIPMRPPEELIVRARDIAGSLGYPRGTGSEAWFQYDRRYPVYVGGRLTPERGTLFAALRAMPSPVVLTYQEGAAAAGQVSIDVDPQGRLRRFLGQPTRSVGEKPVSDTPDWDQLFRAAGLDRAQFMPATPPGGDVLADTTAAWTGVSPSTRPVPVTVEAASLRGQITRFDVRYPWSPNRGFGVPPPLVGDAAGAWLLINVIFSVALPFVAWFNWKRGSADVRSALRMGIYGAAVIFIANALIGKFEIQPGVMLAYFLVYLALEPWTRRLWPHAMVTWARVLAGRWRDPLLGRDLLVVLACVTINYLLQRLIGYGAGWYLDPSTGAPSGDSDFGFALDNLFGGRTMAARMTAPFMVGLSVAITFSTVLFVLRVFLKRTWLTGALFFVIWTPIWAGSRYAEGDWASVVQWGFELAFLFFLITRFGLFAAGAFSTLSMLIDWSILTNDFSAWYGQSSLVTAVVLVAIGLYGFYAALGGRPVAAFVGDVPPR